ncbi:MAG: heme exporter protein CcmD [Gordonibacter sp.]|uniref:heme exporter protein CcmD n=1 Tax=Gordonibacter sp. TaxID=1968902 RepID=UPI002FCAED85
MNPVLAEIYSTIFPAAPYVIGAYALIFLALFVFVFITLRGLKKTEQQMALLEEAVAEKAAN